ncbi:MAG: hypothetical protein ACREJ2_14620, partial [Planctomycetota bacterium]
MTTLRSLNCPQCKSQFQFDPSKGVVTCPSCGQSFQYVRRKTARQEPIHPGDATPAPGGEAGPAGGRAAPRGGTGRLGPVAPANDPAAADLPAAPEPVLPKG